MQHAFPEDELKPLSCTPLTRDRLNPSHIEVNDVLGNYSLTLIDSLSTLAILASSPQQDRKGRNPLEDFQDGIAALVEQYGDGSSGPSGLGKRSRGFDLDSKVQVFETVIRGVGGLVSAHLFAIGELPINGYKPVFVGVGNGAPHIPWNNGVKYDGQLLRLAKDLATRILPAFNTVTGLPYPRVNLRSGIPFYMNSPLNFNPETGRWDVHQPGSIEVTETCSAGAGSLVLEFTTLSRLTGDERFEVLAKKAFRAVWNSKTVIGLVGAGIDAETGQWLSPYTGIGAGIDSFFEYALKSHILLSRSEGGTPNHTDAANDVDYFLNVWEDAHAGIKRHLYRSAAYQHPHYIQGDVYTGASRAFWIDSLSAYYPGLLTLAGELDEAIETHLLYAALWTRYSALPERWSAATGNIDSGLRWWGGRPEFIESTWYLYRATNDPWYLHVGEMTLRDIKRRCWTQCGWAGLEDVRTGLLKDRMESFFLGETIKYLYLLFDSEHPLNRLDAPWVFTTEGHPMILPKAVHGQTRVPYSQKNYTAPDYSPTCPLPPPTQPFSVSGVPARADFFHAACLARMHHLFEPSTMEVSPENPMFAESEIRGPEQAAYYPWTLPAKYIPSNGISSKMENRVTFDLSFPVLPNVAAGPLTLTRKHDGIVVNSISGLKLTLLREMAEPADSHHAAGEVYRIHGVSHLALGRDEKVYMAPEVVAGLNPSDPYFTRHRDTALLDVVVDLASSGDNQEPFNQAQPQGDEFNLHDALQELNVPDDFSMESLQINASLFQQLLKRFTSALESQITAATTNPQQQPDAPTTTTTRARSLVDAVASVGIGSGTLPDVPDAPLSGSDPLPWTSIYLTDELCLSALPAHVPREHQVIVMKRGTCSFSDKMHNIPSFPPSASSLQLIIVVSYPEHDEAVPWIRPLLDRVQYTPGGIARPNPIPMVMVDGDDETLSMLGTAKGIGLRRRYHFSSQGLRISNLIAQ